MKSFLVLTAAALAGLGHAFDLQMFDTTVICNHEPIYHFIGLTEGDVCNDLHFNKSHPAPYTAMASRREGPECTLTIFANHDCSDPGWNRGSGCQYSGLRIDAVKCMW